MSTSFFNGTCDIIAAAIIILIFIALFVFIRHANDREFCSRFEDDGLNADYWIKRSPISDEVIDAALKEILTMSDEELLKAANDPNNDGGIFEFVSEVETMLEKNKNK